MAFILASASPRRKELLKFITSDFSVFVSDAEENVDENLPPEQIVMQLAEIKGEAVFSSHKNDTVISADTVVFCNGKILGKPHSPEEAYSMLSMMSGHTHTVFTGLCILSGDKKIVFYDKTDVLFYELSDCEINEYITSGEPFDKAGAYGIQGTAALFVKSIVGDYYNVMGFPIGALNRKLRENGLI